MPANANRYTPIEGLVEKLIGAQVFQCQKCLFDAHSWNVLSFDVSVSVCYIPFVIFVLYMYFIVPVLCAKIRYCT